MMKKRHGNQTESIVIETISDESFESIKKPCEFKFLDLPEGKIINERWIGFHCGRNHEYGGNIC